MKKIQNNIGFTLVELIVVITILAILGTIAFVSLQGYSSQARDSKRLSDVQNIKKSLELFSLNTGKYPEPDNKVTISYGDQDLRYQGTLGEQVSTNLSRNLNEKPVDPLTEAEYTYSRTYGGTEYEVLSIYESDLISTSPQPSPTGEGARPLVVSSGYAANSNYPKINGNYNGVYVKAGTYYLPSPSIINALNVDLDLEVTTNGLESQIITGGDNNIANAGFDATTGLLTGMSVEIFTGILDTKLGEDDYNNKEILAQALIDAYSGTILASAGIYKEIVDTASEDFLSLVDTFVLSNDNFVNSTSNSNTVSYSCIGSVPSSNVSTSNNTGLTEDVTWQNTDSGANCYYECTEGYTGENCDVSNTKLLIHSDTTNGDTVFIDSGEGEYSPHTITRFGDTSHSTTISKFGSSSIYFDGTDDYLQLPLSDDFVLYEEDFTIDFWLKMNTITRRNWVASMMDDTGVDPDEWGIGFETNGILYLGLKGGWSYMNFGTWPDYIDFHHVAVTREGDVFRTFIDGELIQEKTDSTINISNSNAPVRLGQFGTYNAQWLNGYIDEFRIVKGEAMWTSTFVPPTSAY